MGARDARFRQPRINSERLFVKVASFISSEEEMETIFLYVAARFYLRYAGGYCEAAYSSLRIFPPEVQRKNFWGLRNWT